MIESAPISAKSMTYAEALLYCQFCDHNGYTDWRMPTVEESYIYWKYQKDNTGGWYTYSSSLKNCQVIPVRYI
jgi:hypothetical protein